MKLKYPSLRMNLIRTLTILSDIDYQWEIWVYTDKSKLLEYVGFQIEIENLLDNIIWDAGENLIGDIFRNKTEYAACTQVVERVEALLKKYGDRLNDETYIATPEWPGIMSAARSAVRVMHGEDNWLHSISNALTSLQRHF